MLKLFTLAPLLFAVQSAFAQSIGIGTTTPHSAAQLHVDAGNSITKGLLVTGTNNPASTMPDLGEGSRLMFYPGKGAFRAGWVSGTQWNNSNVGSFSVAMGVSTTAKGSFSTAMGLVTTASGFASTAMGESTIASGAFSIALGSHVSTSGFSGSLTIGDNSTNTVMQTFVDNGMRCRFANGYRFFTNSATTVGAFLNKDANSWAALSDVRKKENFLPVDGESILNKIAAMPQYTWNYKGQDVKTLRHYGPMAQDFYKAFGKDALGTIGCDTLINQQDFLGVNLIALQALERRTTELMLENKLKQQQMEELKQKNKALEAKLQQMEKLEARVEKLERLLTAKH